MILINNNPPARHSEPTEVINRENGKHTGWLPVLISRAGVILRRKMTKYKLELDEDELDRIIHALGWVWGFKNDELHDRLLNMKKKQEENERTNS